MTKYELYQILEENGFEPSEENLDVLVEGLNDGTYFLDEDCVLYEYYWDQMDDHHKHKIANKLGRIGLGIVTAGASEGIRRIHRVNQAKRDAKTLAKKDMGQSVDKEKVEAAQERLNAHATHGNARATEAAASAYGKIAEKGKRSIAAHKQMMDDRAALDKDSTASKNYKGDATKSKNYSEPVHEDYELYQILDINGFEPTNENLDVLKEGLELGEIVLLDASGLSLSEEMSEDYLYMQILANNGFKTTENNVNVLREALENGHVLLMEEDKPEKKKKEKKPEDKVLTKHGSKVLKTAGIIAGVTIASALGTGAAADGLGRAAGEIGAKASAEKAATDAATAETAKTSVETAAKDVAEKEAALKDGGTAASDAYQTAKAEHEAAKTAKAAADKEAEKSAYISKGLNSQTGKKVIRTTAGITGTAAGAGVGAAVGTKLAKKATAEKEESKK